MSMVHYRVGCKSGLQFLTRPPSPGKHLLHLSALILLTTALQCCTPEGTLELVEKKNINAICVGDCITLQGILTTKDGNTGIDYIQLELESRSSDPFGILIFRRKIATAKTDYKGRYQISFLVEPDELTSADFILRFAEPGPPYLDTGFKHGRIFSIARHDTVLTVDYHIPKIEATLHLSIVNPEAIQDGDKLTCQIFYKYGDLRGQPHKHSAIGPNAQFQKEFTVATAAGQYTFIEINKRKNGVDIIQTDSVMIASHQKVTYEVEF